MRIMTFMDYRLPLVCKYKHSYTYKKKSKEMSLYALIIEYNPERMAYYAILIKENGRLHGRHYNRWLPWNDETIIKYMVSMENLPAAVSRCVKEQLTLLDEVNARCSKSK